MLALAGMLLIYFLPIVMPSLNWLCLSNFFNTAYFPNKPSEHLSWIFGLFPIRLRYTGGMLAIGLVGMILSLISVARGWRIQSGTRMMYWSVGVTLLLLFSTVAVQLGTNLPVLQQIDLPADQHVRWMQLEGTSGVLCTAQDPTPSDGGVILPAGNLRLIELQDNRLVLGRQITLPGASIAYDQQRWALKGHVLYTLFEQQLADKSHSAELRVTNLDGSLIAKPAATLQSPSWVSDMFVRDQRLYVFMGYELAIFDIHTPDEPQLLSNEKIPWGKISDEGYKNYLQYRLPIIPGFSARECLETILRRYHVGALNGDKLATGSGIYKLDELKDGEAHFTLISNNNYEPSILESVFASGPSSGVASDGLLYTSHRNDVPGKEMQGVTVFNIKDPLNPKTIAHFAVPSEHWLVVHPLPDGRAIVGGDKLYLLGKPPGWK